MPGDTFIVLGPNPCRLVMSVKDVLHESADSGPSRRTEIGVLYQDAAGNTRFGTTSFEPWCRLRLVNG